MAVAECQDPQVFEQYWEKLMDFLERDSKPQNQATVEPTLAGVQIGTLFGGLLGGRMGAFAGSVIGGAVGHLLSDRNEMALLLDVLQNLPYQDKEELVKKVWEFIGCRSLNALYRVLSTETGRAALWNLLKAGIVVAGFAMAARAFFDEQNRRNSNQLNAFKM